MIAYIKESRISSSCFVIYGLELVPYPSLGRVFLALKEINQYVHAIIWVFFKNIGK